MKFSKQVCERYENQLMNKEEQAAFKQQLATNPYFAIAYKGFKRLKQGHTPTPGTANSSGKRMAVKRTPHFIYRAIIWVVTTTGIVFIVMVVFRHKQPAPVKSRQPLVHDTVIIQVPAKQLPELSQPIPTAAQASDSFSIGFENPYQPGKKIMYSVSRKVWDSVKRDQKSLRRFIKQLQETNHHKD